MALQAWTRNSLNTLLFYFCHELFKTGWICWEKYYFLLGINFPQILAWRDQLFSFFSSSKRGEKKHKTKKKKQVRFHSPSTCFTAWKSSLIFRNMISFTPRVKNSRKEWTGMEFEIHAVKTLIHAPWAWKKFTVFSEIHKHEGSQIRWLPWKPNP